MCVSVGTVGGDSGQNTIFRALRLNPFVKQHVSGVQQNLYQVSLFIAFI
jgi:hypothetical protein